MRWMLFLLATLAADVVIGVEAVPRPRRYEAGFVMDTDALIEFGDGGGITGLQSLSVDNLTASVGQVNVLSTDNEVYGSTAWDGDMTVPTKNAVRDILETLTGTATGLDALPDGQVIGGAATASTIIRPGVGAAETLTIVPWDVDGAAYGVPRLVLRSGNAPSLEITSAQLLGATTADGLTFTTDADVTFADGGTLSGTGVSANFGAIELGNPLPVTEGGTGSRTAAAARAALGTGCVVSGSMQVFDATPTDGTTYLGVGGAMGFGPFSENATRTIIATRSGTIKRCYLRVWPVGSTSSAETSTISLRVNGADYTITSAFKTSVSGGEAFSNTSMNGGAGVPIAAGDTIAIKWVTPAWATNPTSVYINFSFEIE